MIQITKVSKTGFNDIIYMIGETKFCTKMFRAHYFQKLFLHPKHVGLIITEIKGIVSENNVI